MTDLETLKEKFPLLYANYRKAFPKFFEADSTMNKRGHQAYSRIKTMHRARMVKPKIKKEGS